MRNLALANPLPRVARVLIAGGVAVAMIPAASAAPLGGGSSRGAASSADSGVVRVQSTYCTELRRACMYKRELGEAGQGNCAKYRAECSRSGASSSYRYRSYGYRPSTDYYRYRRGYWD